MMSIDCSVNILFSDLNGCCTVNVTIFEAGFTGTVSVKVFLSGTFSLFNNVSLRVNKAQLFVPFSVVLSTCLLSVDLVLRISLFPLDDG